MHPRFLHILTSGIERDILVHSPAASSPCFQDLTLTPTAVRSLSDAPSSTDWFLRATTGPHLTMNEDEDPQPLTIEVFDKCVVIDAHDSMGVHSPTPILAFSVRKDMETSSRFVGGIAQTRIRTRTRIRTSRFDFQRRRSSDGHDRLRSSWWDAQLHGRGWTCTDVTL